MESALGHRGWIALMIIPCRAETAYNFLEITLKYLLITSLATFMSRSEVTYNPMYCHYHCDYAGQSYVVSSVSVYRWVRNIHCDMNLNLAAVYRLPISIVSS